MQLYEKTPVQETYERDLQKDLKYEKRPVKEPYKTDLYKRPKKRSSNMQYEKEIKQHEKEMQLYQKTPIQETYSRDLQKRPINMKRDL